MSGPSENPSGSNVRSQEDESDSYVNFRANEPVVELPTTGPYAYSAEEQLGQTWQPYVGSERSTIPHLSSLAVYKQHSGLLWQPDNGNNSSVFIIMMSTRNNINDYTPNVAALVHCATRADALQHLSALAEKHKNASPIIEDAAIGPHFDLLGINMTRTIWIKEVGHARCLWMINLDDVDGGMHEDGVGEGPEEE